MALHVDSPREDIHLGLKMQPPQSRIKREVCSRVGKAVELIVLLEIDRRKKKPGEITPLPPGEGGSIELCDHYKYLGLISKNS
jgi:hypothetical protein